MKVFKIKIWNIYFRVILNFFAHIVMVFRSTVQARPSGDWSFVDHGGHLPDTATANIKPLILNSLYPIWNYFKLAFQWTDIGFTSHA